MGVVLIVGAGVIVGMDEGVLLGGVGDGEDAVLQAMASVTNMAKKNGPYRSKS